MNQPGMTFTAFLASRLRPLVATVIGPGADTAVAGGYTRADVALVLAALGLAALGHLSLELYARRQRRAAPADAAPTRQHVVAALHKPLAILIWMYGLYLAATPLLGRLSPGGGAAVVRQGMDLALNFAAYAALYWFLLRSTRIIESRLRLWTSAFGRPHDEVLVSLLGSSLRVIVTAAALIGGVSMLALPPTFADAAGKLSSIVLILSVALVLSRAVSTLQYLVPARFDTSMADNLRARQLSTQLHLISRVVYVGIGVFALAAILMLFPAVRHVGTSLLASAGIAGVVIGFAAQKVLGNLFAGVQIALGQVIRQDDVVVVEGEWGRIEEITLSYVVVHIWDDRRLVLPLSYFTEKAFQNWTRTTSALTGSVFVWVDYSLDIEAARQALQGIIEKSTLWDRRFWNLQVSDVTEKAVQLRVLATAADSSRCWDLRCEIREKLIAYIQSRQPGGLPRSRTETVELVPGRSSV